MDDDDPAGARVNIKTHFWMLWSEIAIERESAARQARREAVEEQNRGGNPSESLRRELQAGMMAVVASAFAIDAFYGAVKPFIQISPEIAQRWKENKSRPLLETLKAGFSLGSAGAHWGKEFKWLFRLRSAAVHFREEFREPQLHPMGTLTAVEQITYSFESANRAVNLLLAVIQICSGAPRPSLQGGSEALLDTRAIVNRLVEMRSELS